MRGVSVRARRGSSRCKRKLAHKPEKTRRGVAVEQGCPCMRWQYDGDEAHARAVHGRLHGHSKLR